MKRNFATVKHAKPPSSRKGSVEWVRGGAGLQGAGQGALRRRNDRRPAPAAVILALGLKGDRDADPCLPAHLKRARPTGGVGQLWRLAKIAPILAVPDLIAPAWIENDPRRAMGPIRC